MPRQKRAPKVQKALAAYRERIQKEHKALLGVLEQLETIEQAKKKAGQHLIELEGLGTNSEMVRKVTGLRATQIASFKRLAQQPEEGKEKE